MQECSAVKCSGVEWSGYEVTPHHTTAHHTLLILLIPPLIPIYPHHSTTSSLILLSTPLHSSTTLRYAAVRYTTLPFTPLHSTPLNSLYFILLIPPLIPLYPHHSTTCSLILLSNHSTPLLHYATLRYATQHYAALNYTTPHQTTCAVE